MRNQQPRLTTVDQEAANLFQPHPHLADEINGVIIQSEIEGGVYLRDLPDGAMLEIETRNRCYEIEKLHGNQALISGHPELCPEPVEVTIHGSTWGGSMLKMEFIGREMCLEFRHPERGIVQTTFIQDIRELPARSQTSPQALAKLLALDTDLAQAA